MIEQCKQWNNTLESHITINSATISLRNGSIKNLLMLVSILLPFMMFASLISASPRIDNESPPAMESYSNQVIDGIDYMKSTSNNLNGDSNKDGDGDSK